MKVSWRWEMQRKMQRKMQFENPADVFEAHGGRYPPEQHVSVEFTNGPYLFNYSSPGTGGMLQTVTLYELASRIHALKLLKSLIRDKRANTEFLHYHSRKYSLANLQATSINIGPISCAVSVSLRVCAQPR